MGSRRRRVLLARSISWFAMLVGAPVGSAQAAELRFVHAVPGQGPAALQTDGSAGDPVAFGRVGEYTEVPDGEVTLSLGETEARETLSDGRYTALAWRRDGEITLTVVRDGNARAGRGRLRAINVAGELGESDVLLDGESVGRSLAPGDASDYLSTDPGVYGLMVTRPGEADSALAESDGVDITAGTASTAFVIGSGGRPVEVVLATDDVSAPAEGPATGMGGLDEGTPWVAALLAALCAGVLGGGAYRLARRRGA